MAWNAIASELLLALLCAATVAHLLVPVVATSGVARRAADRTGADRRRSDAIPRLGGVAIAGGVAVSVLVVLSLSKLDEPIHWEQLRAIGLSAAIVFLIGLADDLRPLSPGARLVAELAAAWLVVTLLGTFEVFAIPGIGEWRPGSMAKPIAVLWIVGVTNAINLLDGLDGLATGAVAIISGTMMAYAVLLARDFLTTIMLAAIFGACLGFLRHNREPARIYLGDSGSLTLGFLLACLTMKASLKAPATVATLVPLLALGVPVIDTLLVMKLRFSERRQAGVLGRLARVVHGDRNHLHHLFEESGFTRLHVVRSIHALVLVSCAAALSVALTRRPTIGLGLIGAEAALIALIRRRGLSRRERQPAVDGGALSTGGPFAKPGPLG